MGPSQNGGRNKHVTEYVSAPPHTVEPQTLSTLMNVSCSLIMSCGERLFLLAIFLTKYCWDLVHSNTKG